MKLADRTLTARFKAAAARLGASFANTGLENGSTLPNLGSMNLYPKEGYASCWGYTAPDSREYALLGAQHGLSIVDITDAPNLREVAFISTEKSPWTEIKVYRHYAYLAKDDVQTAGIQVIDLSRLPKRASLVRIVPDYPKNHTLWIEESRGLMFTAGGSNVGVTVWDLTNDPTQPREIGCTRSRESLQTAPNQQNSPRSLLPERVPKREPRSHVELGWRDLSTRLAFEVLHSRAENRATHVPGSVLGRILCG